MAVKRFQPAAELSDGTQLSDALLLWTEEVLEEIGLETRDLFSTVTDAGSDVKRLCLKVCGSAWEWSLPHMLNCALVEVRWTIINAARTSSHVSIYLGIVYYRI